MALPPQNLLTSILATSKTRPDAPRMTLPPQNLLTSVLATSKTRPEAPRMALPPQNLLTSVLATSKTDGAPWVGSRHPGSYPTPNARVGWRPTPKRGLRHI